MDEKTVNMKIEDEFDNDISVSVDKLASWTAEMLDVEISRMRRRLAIFEAVRNSLSIATQMGTLGAIIAFARDGELERREARENASWLRDAESANPADDKW